MLDCDRIPKSSSRLGTITRIVGAVLRIDALYQ